MKTQLLLSVVSAGLLFAIQSANATSCSEEIRNLEKNLSSKSTQMGPVSRETETTSSQAGTEAAKPGQVPETPATAAMNEAVKARAASQEDVQKQNLRQPTAAEEAQGERAAPAPQLNEALVSLQRARGLDQAGKESECMAAIERAKEQIGAR